MTTPSDRRLRASCVGPSVSVVVIVLLMSLFMMSLLVIPVAAAESAAQLHARALALQRQWRQLQQASHEFEAKAAQKQTDYANRQLEESVNAVKQAVACLRNPEPCVRRPSVLDIFNLAKKEMEDVLGTAADLVDLRSDLNGLVAKQLSLAKQQSELDRAERALRRPAATTPSKPFNDVPLPLIADSFRKKSPAELDDDTDMWCWETKGDRCFDGRPQEFQRFLERHPEAKAHAEAVVRAPDRQPTTLDDLNQKYQQDSRRLVRAMNEANDRQQACVKGQLQCFSRCDVSQPGWQTCYAACGHTCDAEDAAFKKALADVLALDKAHNLDVQRLLEKRRQ